MRQRNITTGTRFYTALLKDTHEDSREVTAFDITKVARYFCRTIQDATGQKTANPNFCGESIIDTKIYISPGLKKWKGAKTARQDINEKLYTSFQLFVYKNLDSGELGNILTVTEAGNPCTKRFRGKFYLDHNFDTVIFYQLDDKPTKEKIYGITDEGMHRNINVYICEASLYDPSPTLRTLTDEETGQFYERLETDKIKGYGIGHSCGGMLI